MEDFLVSLRLNVITLERTMESQCLLRKKIGYYSLVTIREQILKEMKRQSVSQAELSRRTGIPPSRLSEWLSGSLRRGATEQTIVSVMKALDLVLADKPAKRTRSKS